MKSSETPKYPHRLRWERLGRQGQSCRILRKSGLMVQVEFEVDGATAVLSRQALVRRQEPPENNSAKI